MPYQIEQLLMGRGMPICVRKDDPAQKALTLMMENDYSQLPVIASESGFDVPKGIITFEGILRGILNFDLKIEDLKVKDVMSAASVFSLEHDMFDILDRLLNTNAVLITDANTPDLVGIVTSYDSTEYFRERTENMMHVEDIEVMVKEFIKACYTKEDGLLDEDRLNAAVQRIANNENREGRQDQNRKSFDDLTMYDYISILAHGDSWDFFEPIFSMKREPVRKVLDGIRLIRNKLAHFRGDITAKDRDQLRFAAKWLSQHQEEFQSRREKEELEKLLASQGANETKTDTDTPMETSTENQDELTFEVIESSEVGGGRYAKLADWLISQPGHKDRVQLTFDEIERIIDADLPLSAYKHRAWWANDAVTHPHAQLWLEAGWRSTYINLTEKRLSFFRIQEREKAYIDFFTELLAETRKSQVPISTVSASGISWLVVQPLTSGKLTGGQFAFSFTRGNRFRVELYLDMLNQADTKAVFDRIAAQKETIEAVLGDLTWERIDDKRASRIAKYHDGSITDPPEQLAALREWAVKTMIDFYMTIDPVGTQAISAVGQV